MEENKRQDNTGGQGNDLYRRTQVTIPNARFVYCKLDKPETTQSGVQKYGCCLLLEKSDSEVRAALEQGLAAAMELGAQRVWGGKRPEKVNVPVHDGDTERPDQASFAGKLYMNVSSTRRPRIYDRHRKVLDQPGEFRSGDYGVALVRFKAYSRNGNNGIGAYIDGIMKTRDSDGAVDVEAAFGDYFEPEGQGAPAAQGTGLDFLGL